MVTVEQTEKVESGLDVVVRGEHGGIICWCYSMSSAEMIANALNNNKIDTRKEADAMREVQAENVTLRARVARLNDALVTRL